MKDFSEFKSNLLESDVLDEFQAKQEELLKQNFGGTILFSKEQCEFIRTITASTVVFMLSQYNEWLAQGFPEP